METHADRFNAAIGRQLRAEIAAGGSSIAAMSRQLGIARSALDNYVNGRRAIPVPILYQVADALSVDAHLIVVRAQERLAAESSNVIEGRFGASAGDRDELDAVARVTDPEPTDEQ